MAARRYWLLKSDAESFGFDDLLASAQGMSAWDGVRNYQARSFLREMRRGDQVLFYHSGGQTPAVAGIAQVVREAYPDPTQFEPAHEHFDPRSKKDDPPWVAVDVRAERALPRLVALEELRREPALAALRVCQRGNRLSVHPVDPAEWAAILTLAKRKPRT